MMQILKSASDEAIYNRAKAGHDGTMDAYIKWFERGCEPRESRLNSFEKQKYRQAQAKVKVLCEVYTAPEIARAIKVHSQTIHQLKQGAFRHVGMERVKTILAFDGEIKQDQPKVTQEEHNRAVEIVRGLYSKLDNMPKVAIELGLSVSCLWKFQKDQHRIPSPAAHKIINYNQNNTI